ncbi:hypothetical protein [Motiliproteus sediminis]|uniref:hypothetical protein n=1 Tax=Motiliproteus sediminis TaxID=1468178 RepID=UPI001AEF9844|nr:hypothetical protein [Motiliproteus sediminis]
MKRLLRWFFWLPLVLMVPPLLLVSAGFYGYQRLTAESALAELQFSPAGPRRYLAAVTWADGCRTDEYLLLGDQWRVDARFIKWKYWVSLLGLDPVYRLERLEGRYASVSDQNSQPLLAHDLGERAAVDLLASLSDWSSFNPLLDASYGSSAYVDIDPQRRYRLYRTQTGLLIRSQSAEMVATGQGGLTITIAHPCGDLNEGWQALATGFNRWWLGVR